MIKTDFVSQRMLITKMSLSHIYFNSGASAPYYMLSNFYGVEISVTPEDFSPIVHKYFPQLEEWIGDELIFPSTEHLWQSFKSSNAETFFRFTIDGDIALTTDFFACLLATKKKPEDSEEIQQAAKKKVSYWSKKNQVGIVAKMAVADNPGRQKRLGITGMLNVNKKMSPKLEKALWNDILKLKYTQDSCCQQVLLDSQPKKLVEFDRMAISRGGESYWGAAVDNKGVLWGHNQMGKYIMKVREDFHKFD